MNVGRRTLLGSGLLIAGLVGLAAFVIAVFVIGGDEPLPDPPPPLAEPAPPPEPPPPPVEGTVELANLMDLSITGSRLARPGSGQDEPVDVDQDAVDALVAELTAWLDAHLTDLQEDGDGLVAEVGLVGPEDAGQLAGPGEPIEEAHYTMVIGARGAPEWARVNVRVTTPDNTAHAATFAFTGSAEPELQGVEDRS